MGKTIEIPEGYEARIEGSKVILELKGSEDERIRQAIESIIRVYGKTQGEWIAGYDMDTLVVHLRDAFASLERQKEKPICLSTGARKRLIETIWSDIEECIKGVSYFPFSKSQKEQKPAEKQDYSGLTELEGAIHRGFLCAGVENVPVAIIRETANECLARMKPAEWSDVEKMHLANAILAAGKEWGVDSYTVKFLESLRPSWKPSEEQMEALTLAIKGKWEAIKPTGYMSRRLEDLYEGLANTFKVECKLEE